MSLFLWREVLKDACVLVFIDNEAARFSWISGAARNEDVSRMLRRGAFKEAAMNTVPYFCRVPTHSNIADGPSPARTRNTLQGQHHYKIQFGAQNEERTRGTRESGVHGGDRTPITGGKQGARVAGPAGQLHGMEPCGCADAPTIPKKARPGCSTPEGPGCRVSGSTEAYPGMAQGSGIWP